MKKEKIETPAYMGNLEYGPQYKFDKYDKLLIQGLDKNARTSLSELSQKVGLSRDAIRKRIQKLIEAKVISAFKPIFQPPRMGFPIINYVFISLYNPTEKQEEELINYLRSNKNITYIATIIGKWDLIIDIVAENQDKFDKIFKGVRHKFPKLIKDYEIYGVLEEYKYEDFGKLIYD